MSAGIPGSPEHTSALQRRLAKAEKDILSLKTRICCDRASWEMRFNDLQRKHDELRVQVSGVCGVGCQSRSTYVRIRRLVVRACVCMCVCVYVCVCVYKRASEGERLRALE